MCANTCDSEIFSSLTRAASRLLPNETETAKRNNGLSTVKFFFFFFSTLPYTFLYESFLSTLLFIYFTARFSPAISDRRQRHHHASGFSLKFLTIELVMKYPQLVSSRAVSEISEWLIKRLEDLDIEQPSVYSRLLLSLLHTPFKANAIDLLELPQLKVKFNYSIPHNDY